MGERERFRIPSIANFTGNFPGEKYARDVSKRERLAHHFKAEVEPKLKNFNHDSKLVDNNMSLVGHYKGNKKYPSAMSKTKFSEKPFSLSDARRCVAKPGLFETCPIVKVNEPGQFDWTETPLVGASRFYPINKLEACIKAFDESWNTFEKIYPSPDIFYESVHNDLNFLQLVSEMYTELDQAVAILDNVADRNTFPVISFNVDGYLNTLLASSKAVLDQAQRFLDLMILYNNAKRLRNIPSPHPGASVATDVEVAKQHVQLAEKLAMFFESIKPPAFITTTGMPFLEDSYWS